MPSRARDGAGGTRGGSFGAVPPDTGSDAPRLLPHLVPNEVPDAAARQRRPEASAAAVAVGVAALAGGLVALAALGNGFPNDDQWIVAEALDLREPSRWWHALTRPWWPNATALWRPVTTLQLAVETWLGGGAAWPSHAVNALVHALASGLVAMLALRVAPPVVAAAAGILFAWMPIHVEPIATLVGRADLGAAVGLLATALLAWRTPVPGRRDGWQLATAAAFALGSKESGVVAPAIAWAVARLAGRSRAVAGAVAGVDGPGGWRAAAWSAAGLAPLLVGRWLVLGTLGGDEPHPAWVGLPAAQSIPLALRSLAVGASYLLWPRPPVFEHAPPWSVITSPGATLVASGGALLLGAAVALVVHWRRPSAAWIAPLWWGATILPVSNLVFRSGIVLADRTLYAPSVAVAVAVAWVGGWLRGVARGAWVAAVLAVAALGGARTWADLPVWKDSGTVIAAFIERAPQSWSGWLFRGLGRLGQGDREGAKADFERGLALYPYEGRLLRERARIALQDGDTTRAEGWLRESVRVYPKAIRTRQILLDLLARRGDGAGRCPLLAEGLRLAPDQRRWAADQATLRAQGVCR